MIVSIKVPTVLFFLYALFSNLCDIQNGLFVDLMFLIIDIYNIPENQLMLPRFLFSFFGLKTSSISLGNNRDEHNC